MKFRLRKSQWMLYKANDSPEFRGPDSWVRIIQNCGLYTNNYGIHIFIGIIQY